MKRSEINKALRRMERMIQECRFALPPFCAVTPEEWTEKGHDYDEVRENMLGWDITDYGLGNFDKVGFSLITLRNGNLKLPQKYPKTYAEKLLYLEETQYAPNHFHWKKMEDIINRGGGTLLIRVYQSMPNEDVDFDRDVCVRMDGVQRIVPAGTQLVLEPGMSVSVPPRLYHDFSVVPGTGPVLIGEVSQCNDDETDNRFQHPMGRFPTIEEDEAPYRLLCNEYPPAREQL